MIKNDLQYRVAKSTLKKFQATLDRHDTLTDDQEPWVKEAHKASIIGEIMKLKGNIEEYECIKSGDVTMPPLDLIAEIPNMLIKRRIALGWTQEDLARRLRVRAQQVQNDEATNYETASLSRLMRTARILQRAKPRRKKSIPVKQTKSRRLAK